MDPSLSNRRRKSIRLKEYDYSQAGAYFITLVTHNRECLFGAIINSIMVRNGMGDVISCEWQNSAQIRHEIELDEFVIMPNHLHAIVFNTVGATGLSVGATGGSPLPHGPASKSLGSLVAGFKSVGTVRINHSRQTPGMSVWQRNYYDHIIRNEDELNSIHGYIHDNPINWEQDQENPKD